MKTIKPHTLIAISILFCACGPVFHALHRSKAPLLNQITAAEEFHLRPDSLQHHIRVEHLGEQFFLVASDTLEGESVAKVDIPTIEVKAVMRSVPERNGKVLLAFRVDIPSCLLGTSSQIELTPVLHRKDGNTELKNISLRGETFSLLSSRENFQHELYVRRFARDTIDSIRSSRRFLRSGYVFGSRLDSVLTSKDCLSFLFTEEVDVRGDERKMSLTVNTALKAIGHSKLVIPSSDTLKYTISSMTWFIDNSVRYKEIVVSRDINLERSYDIVFPVGKSQIIDTMANNAKEMERLKNFLYKVQSSSDEFILDSVVISAFSSPEGREEMNHRLTKLRAGSICSLVCHKDDDIIAGALIPRAQGEDWKTLEARIEGMFPNNSSSMLAIFSRIEDLDLREAELRSRFPKQYRLLRNTVYPLLRRVSCKVHLRRKGMEKDTIHTTIVDSAYMNAVELLKQRRYAASLLTLAPYRDINTVIAHLSMGHNSEAMEILGSIPQTGITEYLFAIACSRLGLKEEGKKHLENAVRMNQRLKYRIGLDPELAGLVDIQSR